MRLKGQTYYGNGIGNICTIMIHDPKWVGKKIIARSSWFNGIKTRRFTIELKVL